MKGFQTGLAALAGAVVFLVGSATAQTNTPTRRGRLYNSRIRMHTAPPTLVAPDNRLEKQTDASTSVERGLMIPNDMPRESQIQPKGLRLGAIREKQENRDRILPLSTEKKDDEIMLDQQKATAPSGWGWLADDVHVRQQREKGKADQDKKDSEEKDNEFQSPSVLPKESGDSKTDGIFLDTAFKPVSASMPTKEKGMAKAVDTSTLTKNRDEQKIEQAGPTTSESPLNRASTDPTKEQTFGADATWGNESLWNKNSKAVHSLPQTEALLSIFKPDVRKQSGGFDLPDFKANVRRNAGDWAGGDRSKTGHRNFDTAAGFQPLPAVPVHELGNTPWAGGIPGAMSSGGSTPFTPESSITPSRPIESLNAPELPTPVATPWLR